MSNKSFHREKGIVRLDQAKLKALALHYVGRYATTQAKLRRYLERKVGEREWDGDTAPDIAQIVDHCVGYGYVNDRSFAEARADALARRGYGTMRISGALRQAGIDAQVTQDICAQAPDDALAAALRFAKRKSIGPFSSKVADEKSRQRMMSALIRAGHSFEIARAIMRARAEGMIDEEV
ncbi:MAG: regulatory protein RecX [Sphingomonadaceae bacterium]